MGKRTIVTRLQKAIGWYLERGLSLIPIKTHGLNAGKAPFAGWAENDYSEAQIREFAQKGHNIGFRLGQKHIVIDVDPRNMHKTSMKAFLELHNFEKVAQLIDFYPTVVTGSGGYHFYARLPKNIEIECLKEEIPEAKGIEIKKFGRQVIIPGSKHPETGKLYHFDDFSPIFGKFPALNDQIIDAYFRDYENSVNFDENDIPERPLTDEELEKYLKKLPVTDFTAYNDWWTVMAAVHEASAGRGFRPFLKWSKKDPNYADDDTRIKQQWAGLRRHTGKRITRGTLFDLYAKYKETDGNDDPVDVFMEKPFDEEKVKKLMTRIDNMPVIDVARDVKKIAKQASKLGGVPLERVKHYVKRKVQGTGTMSCDRVDKTFDKVHSESIKEIRRILKETEEEEAIDQAVVIAKALLRQRYKDGEHLVHAQNQQFYRWKKTHWVPVLPNVLNAQILKIAQEIEGVKTPSILFGRVEKVLTALCARENDVLRFSNFEPPSVINCQNCEVWINDKTGHIKTTPHRPSSYLRSVILSQFDDSAECPRFTKYLEETFGLLEQTDEMVDYIFELLGYILQPRKNLAAWWLLYGRGANGKTVFLDILTSLVSPDNTLPRSVHDFCDTNRNSHALASLVNKSLVIDDDLDTSQKLPSGALKKLSELKLLEANPKNKDAFSFVSHASIVIASNNWPHTSDLSLGFLRRVNIIPFNRILPPEQWDINLAQRIIDTELPGILNRALEGLVRLRKRGRFTEPVDCVKAKHEWLRSINNAVEFLTRGTFESPKAVTKDKELYEAYYEWSKYRNDKRGTLSFERFCDTMLQLKMTPDQNGVVKGVALDRKFATDITF